MAYRKDPQEDKIRKRNALRYRNNEGHARKIRVRTLIKYYSNPYSGAHLKGVTREQKLAELKSELEELKKQYPNKTKSWYERDKERGLL